MFDSSQRRVCEVRPRRTNTPLHALTLLNDLSLLEASRALARTALSIRHDETSRIDFIFQAVLSREPMDTERQVLNRELERTLNHYKSVPRDAERFLQFGQPEQRRTQVPSQLAAYTVLTSLVFNLDEAMTHE